MGDALCIIDAVIKSSSPWKAPDRYGIQMGFVQRAYPVIGDWISFEAESLGLIADAQYGGRPGHSTVQAVDGYIHRVKTQLDQGNTVSTLFYDLKGAFNRVSHRVVQLLDALGKELTGTGRLPVSPAPDGKTSLPRTRAKPSSLPRGPFICGLVS
ncbi:hypothetical protein C8R44DRAFT_725289 [Mycena epipterygia]|nr:hypothetical protein C8R44DRAFT_725289 [Mycena epipterygia]